MFTTGRIIFMIFFVVAFIALMIFSYRKDAKNHQRFYKNAGIKVALYGTLIIAIFVILRYFTSN
ncbi:MAG: hypothetical protein JXQ93_04005 [Flavobacteriaceae bacterium]